MRLKNKTVGVLIGPGYEEMEFWVVLMRLKEEGAQVKVIGLKEGEIYPGKHGCIPGKADSGPGEVTASQLDALHIPGGWAPDKMRRDKTLMALIKEMDTRKKVIGMICHGGLMGISARIVKGKRATGSGGIKDDLENAGAIWVDEPAFREKNIVWGRVVEDIPAYNRELIKAIEEG